MILAVKVVLISNTTYNQGLPVCIAMSLKCKKWDNASQGMKPILNSSLLLAAPHGTLSKSLIR